MPAEPRFLPAGGYDRGDACERVGAILRALARAYPDARCALRYEGPWQLLVATILSAQCTDAKVNEVTPALFKRYDGPEALAAADPSEVEKLIYSTGFFRQKTKSIVGASKVIVDEHGGIVPSTIDELASLPGVGRKTANVVLAQVQPGKGHGIFVDTHVRRVSQRLALTAHDDPVRIERDLMDLFPKRSWALAPQRMIHLGRGPCEAKRPDHAACPLRKWCPTGKRNL